MKYLSIIIILFFSQFAKGQQSWYGEFSYPTAPGSPIRIVVRDSVDKELGRFTIDPVTRRTTSRGSITICFSYFLLYSFTMTRELNAAKLQIVKQIKSDGTIRDTVLYKAAILNYELLNKQYGYPE